MDGDRRHERFAHRAHQTHGSSEAEVLGEPVQRVLRALADVSAAEEPFEQAQARRERRVARRRRCGAGRRAIRPAVPLRRVARRGDGQQAGGGQPRQFRAEPGGRRFRQ